MNGLANNQLILLNIINHNWFRFSAVESLFSVCVCVGELGLASWLRFTESELAISHFSVNKIGI